MFQLLALHAAFFLSGAAGLIFQIVWLYRATLVLGSSVAAVTVVLSGFMAGLAAGNALAGFQGTKIQRPLNTYAALELLVAATGLAMTYVMPYAGTAIGWVIPVAGDSGVLLNLARFLVAFILLLIPSTAMGATLPILVAALCRTGDRFGSALGRLYGWNTLGAVAGVILCEVVLIAATGVAGSAWVAALLNVTAAVLALASGASEAGAVWRSHERARATTDERRASLDDAEPGRTVERVSGGRRLYAATALSGALLLGLEVAWFRLLSMYVLVTTLAMSLMLAVVLAGIGGGGLFASAWLRRRNDVAAMIPLVACASGVAVVASYAAFTGMTAGTQVGAWWTVLWFAVVLTLAVSLLSGVLFTLIGNALHGQRSAVEAAGRLTLANTLGAMCGPPVATYLLLPLAGMERTFFALALAYGAVAFLCVRRARTPAASPVRAIGRTVPFAVAAALIAGVAMFRSGSNRDYFARAASAYAADGSSIVATREGPSETLFVMQQQWLGAPVYSRLVTNGFSMSGTALQGQRYMRAFAYYPMLLHDGPLRRALVVCYGVGVTVGAVTHIPSVESIDVAEISRDVIAMSDAIYPAGARPLGDHRVRLHIEDGRFFLQTTRDTFDLITGEPPPPRTPGTVNIYTREYFQLVRNRLAPGGMATYWVPVARPHPGTDVNSIMRAFCDVFSDCSLWNATPFDLMLVGTRDAEGPRTIEQFSSAWQTAGLEARMREVGFERPEQMGATFLADAASMRELLAGTPAVTDNFPQRLRPLAGRHSLSDPSYGIDPAATHMYQELLDPRRARTAFQASPWIRQFWPDALISRTLPYFDVQAIVNRVYWEGGRPLGQIEDLDAVLTNTTLRTLPLWILGSDEVKQRIAEASSDMSGAVEYARALRALSGRDYGGAAQWLSAAERRGLRAPAVRPLVAYALAKSGQLDVARRLSVEPRGASDDEQHFWRWFDATVGER
jgi:spermidine synthase